MMVRVPSCNIDRPIYIWRMEIKLKDTCTPLHICRQGLPSFILISNKPHCWAIKKGSLWNKLAWWPLPASSIPMPPLSPTTNHHHTPLLLTLSLIFLPPFLYTRGHYRNYNLHIYKATNTNRCNINGVCLVVLAKEDINYPLHACGSS